MRNDLVPTGFARRAALIFGAWALCLGTIFALSFLALSWSVENELFSRVLEGEGDAFRSIDQHANEVWRPGTPGVDGGASIEALRERLPDGFDPSQPGPQVMRTADGREVRAIALDPELGERSRVVMMDMSALMDRQQRTDRYMAYLGVAALLVILSTAAISYVAGRQIASPVSRLSRLLRGSGDKPLPDKFAAEFGVGELGHLAGVLETSLGETRQSLLREKTFNAGLSHELRTGLQTAEQAVELLRLAPDPEHRYEVLDRLDRAIVSMRSASEAVLWLSRPGVADRLALNPVLRASLQALEHQAAARQISLCYDGDAQPVARIPAEVLTVLVNNLLRNAIQHSGGRQVVLCATRTGFCVTDNGRGLNLAQSSLVDDQGVMPDASGAGLGLILCRRLLQRFGGGMRFISSETGGLTVQVHLPA